MFRQSGALFFEQHTGVLKCAFGHRESEEGSWVHFIFPNMTALFYTVMLEAREQS